MKHLTVENYTEIEGLKLVNADEGHFRYKEAIDVYAYYFPNKGYSCVTVFPGTPKDSLYIQQALKNSNTCSRISSEYNGKEEADFSLLHDNLESLLYEYKLLKLLDLDSKQ